MCVCRSVMSDSVTLWTVAEQAPLILQARILEWVAMPFSRGSSPNSQISWSHLCLHCGHHRTFNLVTQKYFLTHKAQRYDQMGRALESVRLIFKS